MKKKAMLAAVVTVLSVGLVACGKSETSANSPVAATQNYNATLAEGIQFLKPGYPNFIKAVSGMSSYEPSLRWTDGKNVSFTFMQKLPATFTLGIEYAGAFGPNAGKSVTVQVGDWKGQFVASADSGVATLTVKSSVPSDKIEFVIPEPKSPKELQGGEGDPRLLGIGFKRISIL